MNYKRKSFFVSSYSFNYFNYGYLRVVFLHGYARDTNIVCAGYRRKTRGIIAQVVFSILTLGIYNLIWIYGAGDRIFFNCTKRNIPNTVSGGSVLLWYILGTFIIIGSFVGLYQLISGLNQLCIDYNRNHVVIEHEIEQ